MVEYDVAQAAAYDRHRTADLAARRALAARVADTVGLAPGDRVLDVGCGPGAYLAVLDDRWVATGVDVSDAMLARARSRVPGVPLVRGDAHRLPFGDGAFACAFLAYVLHQLADPGEALREVGRVARAAAVVTTAVEEVDDHPLWRAFPRLPVIDRGRFPPIDDLVGLMGDVGFGEVRRQRVSFRFAETVDGFLEKVRAKYISTLSLLSEEEFRRGLVALEADLRDRYGDAFERVHVATVIVARP